MFMLNQPTPEQKERSYQKQNPSMTLQQTLMMGKLELNIISHLTQTWSVFLIHNDIHEDQEKKTYLAEYVRIQI